MNNTDQGQAPALVRHLGKGPMQQNSNQGAGYIKKNRFCSQ